MIKTTDLNVHAENLLTNLYRLRKDGAGVLENVSRNLVEKSERWSFYVYKHDDHDYDESRKMNMLTDDVVNHTQRLRLRRQFSPLLKVLRGNGEFVQKKQPKLNYFTRS